MFYKLIRSVLALKKKKGKNIAKRDTRKLTLFFSPIAFLERTLLSTQTHTYTHKLYAVDLLLLNGACENVRERENERLPVINIGQKKMIDARKERNERRE